MIYLDLCVYVHYTPYSKRRRFDDLHLTLCGNNRYSRIYQTNQVIISKFYYLIPTKNFPKIKWKVVSISTIHCVMYMYY